MIGEKLFLDSDVCNAKADESSKCVTLTSNFPSLREINVSTPPAFGKYSVFSAEIYRENGS